ncbi:MAG: hypothetical protein K9L28_10830 [Synergistales bacterium]|nr:hypothetical protein [Synergistales bacterium]
MSDPHKRRLYRAVRLIPEAVRISREEPGNAETPGGEPAEEEQAESPERKQLADAEQRNRELQAERDSGKEHIGTLQQRVRELEQQLDRQKKQADKEKEKLRKQHQASIDGELEQARRKGHDEGYSNGFQEGEERAREETRQYYDERFGKLVELLEGVHRELSGHLDELYETNEPKLVRFWEMVLRKLLDREVHADGGTVLQQLRKVLNRVSDRERLMIYLAPGDVQTVEDRQSEFSDILRGVRHMEFVADESVDRGSCLVETNLGVYDARWTTLLELVHNEVEQVVRGGEQPGPEDQGSETAEGEQAGSVENA